MPTYSVTNGSWTYRLYVSETNVDAATNTSTLSCNMRIYRANGTYSYITNGKYALKCTVNGTTKTSSTVTVNKSKTQPEVSVTTLTFPIEHDKDGSKTASITYCQFISSGGTSPSTSTLGSMPKNITLTDFNRHPVVKLKVGGTWVSGVPSIKINDTWYDADEVYVKSGGTWYEVDWESG